MKLLDENIKPQSEMISGPDLTPRAQNRRKLLGIPRDQVLESNTLKAAIDGTYTERNGLTFEMIARAEKSRAS